MRKILFFLLIILCAGIQAQPLMTLEEAVTIGLKNNYNIQIARNQEQIALNNKGYGTAGFLPKIDVTSGYSKVDNKLELDRPVLESNTDINNWNAEIKLNWTLFDGFKMFIDKSKYNELAEQTRYRIRHNIESTIVQISYLYFNLVQQEQLYQVYLDTRDVSKTRLSREKIRNQIGGASSTDLFNAKVSFNNDQSSLLSQELQVKIAREQLNVLLGRDPSTEFTVSPEIHIPELTIALDKIKEQALKQNSNLKAAEFNKKAADRNVQASRTKFLPKLSMFASYGYADQTQNSDVGDFPNLDVGKKSTDATVGLSLSFNLFNGRRDKIELQNAKIAANNQELVLRDTRNQLVGLVQEIYDTYHQRLQLMALEEENIEAAQTNLNLQRERHNLGVASSLAFRDAQVSFARVQTALIAARFQARISRLELEQLIGMLEIE